MKISLHNSDAKMLAMEEGVLEVNNENRRQRIAHHLKIFKWFITINVSLLIIFCSYALWSLYQLENAMKSREGTISMSNKYLTSANSDNAELNESVVSDYQEWRDSIFRSLEDLKNGGSSKSSYDFQFLLHTITSILENFVDQDNMTTKSDYTTEKNKLIITNLTDFEIHILKEFMRLKMPYYKSRIPRTIKGGPDTSQCEISLSLDSNIHGNGIVIEPVREEEKEDKQQIIDVDNKAALEDISIKRPGNVRKCSFKIRYKPSKN